MTMSARAGFSMIELVVAMGVGLFVINVAVGSFFFNQKMIHRIETIGAKNEVAQDAVLWAMNKQYLGTTYPAGPQFRQIGVAALTYQGGDRYLLVQVQDWTPHAGTVAPTTDESFVVPVTGN
jgi:hypothetical protein